MSVSKGILVILGNSLVEVVVLFLSDVRLFSQPQSLDLVDSFPLPNLFSNSLGLGLLGLLLVFGRLGFTLILDFSIIGLGGFLIDGFLLDGLFGFLIGDGLSDFLGEEKLDGVLDELGVFLDEVLDLVLLHILYGVILQVKSNAGTSAESIATRILGNEELGIGG